MFSPVVSQFVQYSGVPVCPVHWYPSLSSTVVSQFVQYSGVLVCPVHWYPSLSSTEHTQASALSLSHSCKIDRIQVATLEQGNTEQVSGFKASCHSKCSKSKAIHGVNCTRPLKDGSSLVHQSLETHNSSGHPTFTQSVMETRVPVRDTSD